MMETIIKSLNDYNCELDKMIESQKKHCYRLWERFMEYMHKNKSPEADNVLTRFYLDAQHVLFAMEKLNVRIKDDMESIIDIQED